MTVGPGPRATATACRRLRRRCRGRLRRRGCRGRARARDPLPKSLLLLPRAEVPAARPRGAEAAAPLPPLPPLPPPGGVGGGSNRLRPWGCQRPTARGRGEGGCRRHRRLMRLLLLPSRSGPLWRPSCPGLGPRPRLGPRPPSTPRQVPAPKRLPMLPTRLVWQPPPGSPPIEPPPRPMQRPPPRDGPGRPPVHSGSPHLQTLPRLRLRWSRPTRVRGST